MSTQYRETNFDYTERDSQFRFWQRRLPLNHPIYSRWAFSAPALPGSA